MKETREQYQARKAAQAQRRAEWQKRVQERAAKRKAEAMEQATAQYNQNRHYSASDLGSMKSFDLINAWYGMPDSKDRDVFYAEIIRRAKKRAKKDGTDISTFGFDDTSAPTINKVHKAQCILCPQD